MTPPPGESATGPHLLTLEERPCPAPPGQLCTPVKITTWLARPIVWLTVLGALLTGVGTTIAFAYRSGGTVGGFATKTEEDSRAENEAKARKTLSDQLQKTTLDVNGHTLLIQQVVGDVAEMKRDIHEHTKRAEDFQDLMVNHMLGISTPIPDSLKSRKP